MADLANKITAKMMSVMAGTPALGNFSINMIIKVLNQSVVFANEPFARGCQN